MYYPQSQIKTNLYTTGRGNKILFTTSDRTQIYIGHYYETSNGNCYTGKSPKESPNSLLFPPIKDRLSNYPNEISPLTKSPPLTNYREILSTTVPTTDTGEIPEVEEPSLIEQYVSIRGVVTNQITIIPSSIPTLPTSQDYEFGEFQRYFAKKNNELRYLEIDKQTYTLLQNEDPTIAWDLYTPITVTWELSGDKEKTYNINKNVVNLAEQNNKWYGFTQWFKDKFLKYYQNLIPQENLYTSGKEFETPNGREYIGLYHIHPENGAMVGATHIKKKHDFLTPINSTILSPLTSSQSPPNTSSSPSNGGGGY